MRFLIDAQLPSTLADHLAELGHDAIHAGVRRQRRDAADTGPDRTGVAPTRRGHHARARDVTSISIPSDHGTSIHGTRGGRATHRSRTTALRPSGLCASSTSS